MIAGLPAPLADGGDPAAGYLATLGGLEPAEQAEALLAAITGDAGVPPAVAGVAGDQARAGPRADRGG